MDGLSSTEFAFVAALYLFSPNALQAQQGDFGQMLRAAAPAETRQLIRDADAQARSGPHGAAQLSQAAAARRRKREAEREAFAAMSAMWRQQRPGAVAARAGGRVMADMPVADARMRAVDAMIPASTLRPLVASTTAP